MFYSSARERPFDPSAKKRKRRLGLILRLVDVIFILLFGFIVISEIENKSVIKLAKSVTSLPDIPDKEIVVFIGVLTDGRYLIENESESVDNLAEMEKYINLKQQFFKGKKIQMRVRIRANYDAAVKHAFPIVSVCKDRGIPVGLDVVKNGRRSEL